MSYSLSFGTYAFMISSGFVVHSIFLTECGHPTVDKQGERMSEIMRMREGDFDRVSE